ncbi:MAG: M20 family metallopeptidase [Victivallaceae bacterium]
MFEDLSSEIIARNMELVKKLSDEIYTHPELGLEEFHAVKFQTAMLREFGFQVSFPCAEPTAFRAETGEGENCIAILSEYDALPGLGHACGHNLIAGAAIAAALAVKEIMQTYSIPGKLVILGTPAEEGIGGKIHMLKQGVFQGIECCLICHPFHSTGIDHGNLAVSRYEVIFKGKSAHAATDPEKGLNALDAVNLLYAGVNAWRQQLPDSARVHGIITDGGKAPNIIPDRSGVLFYLRAEDNSYRQIMEKRFEDIAKGAALMTGTEHELIRHPNAYDANLPNIPLGNFIFEQAQKLGMNPQLNIRERISTDFGNVSQVIPGVNFFFQVTRDSSTALHSPEFCEIAGTQAAFERAMSAAQVMTLTALSFLTDADFRKTVINDFLQRKSEQNI